MQITTNTEIQNLLAPKEFVKFVILIFFSIFVKTLTNAEFLKQIIN